MGAHRTAWAAVDEMEKRLGTQGGVICIDKKGRFGAAHIPLGSAAAAFTQGCGLPAVAGVGRGAGQGWEGAIAYPPLAAGCVVAADPNADIA